MPELPEGVERKASPDETWTTITGDNRRATKRRREAYDRWFTICTCGHYAESHPTGGTCTGWKCDCTGYDHITGKPDHPCSPLPADDPRIAKERERWEAELLSEQACQRGGLTMTATSSPGELIEIGTQSARECIEAALDRVAEGDVEPRPRAALDAMKGEGEDG